MTINDPAEQNLVTAHAFGRYWIGAIDESDQGAFTWVTGEPLNNHQFFPPRERTQRPREPRLRGHRPG